MALELTRTLTFRLQPELYQQLVRAAETCHRSVSEVVRLRLQGLEIRPQRRVVADEELLRQLVRVGSNLNQQTRVLHQVRHRQPESLPLRTSRYRWRGHGRSRRELRSPGRRRHIAWLTTRNLPVDDPAIAPRWMCAWANQNPQGQETVHHSSPTGSSNGSTSKSTKEVIALHRDREHHHIHIVVNRVGPVGRSWKPRFDALEQQKACASLAFARC